MKLENYEVLTLLLALEHYVKCDFDEDTDELFGNGIEEYQQFRAVDELEQQVTDDEQVRQVFRELYQKVVSEFVPYE